MAELELKSRSDSMNCTFNYYIINRHIQILWGRRGCSERSGNHCSERPSLPSPGPPTTPGPHPQRPCDSDWGAPTSGLQFPKDSPLQPQIPSLAHPQARFLPCGPSATPPLPGAPPPPGTGRRQVVRWSCSGAPHPQGQAGGRRSRSR